MTLRERKTIVFVHVDDTLLRSFGSKRFPIASVVEHVRELHAQGFVPYCWSTRGADYSRASAEELGIAECFTGFLPKPDVLIDDQHPSEWRTVRCVHPNEAATLTPEDYRSPRKARG